jgi:hypothetical protein
MTTGNPINEEQLAREAGQPLTHRLVRFAHVSRRSERLLGPPQGLLLDGWEDTSAWHAARDGDGRRRRCPRPAKLERGERLTVSSCTCSTARAPWLQERVEELIPARPLSVDALRKARAASSRL